MQIQDMERVSEGVGMNNSPSAGIKKLKDSITQKLVSYKL